MKVRTAVAVRRGTATDAHARPTGAKGLATLPVRFSRRRCASLPLDDIYPASAIVHLPRRYLARPVARAVCEEPRCDGLAPQGVFVDERVGWHGLSRGRGPQASLADVPQSHLWD